LIKKVGIVEKMKYYAVKNGRSSGVYTDWSDCESQVKGYSGNQYKSFNSKAEATAYMNNGSSKSSSPNSYSGSSGGYSKSYSSSSSYSKANSSSYTKPSTSSTSSTSTSSSSSYSTQYYGSSSYYSSSSYISSSETSSKSASKPTVKIYTDGASKNNQARKQGLSRAGYGVYYGPGDSRNHSGRVSGEQTNQRGELEGIHHALKNSLEESKSGEPSKFIIHTDSEYSKNSITKWGDNWDKNGYKTSTGSDVCNKDLISDSRRMIDEIRKNNSDVEFVKVKGHSGNHGNDMADKLAVEGCSKD
jgi:ribonuclease HI